ncbi:hypothetical protein, partial [Lactococcus lactis]|uniref:hypothetical protein n=1 Tax=Lactococcus lactis TaxID=1358 RepID=UPI000A4E3EE4
ELLFGFGFAYEIANMTASVMDFLDPLKPIDLQAYYNVIQQMAYAASGVTMTADIDLGQRLFSQTNTDHSIYYYMISYRAPYYMHNFDYVVSTEAAHYDD